MAFAVNNSVSAARTSVRRVRPFPINLERVCALALNVGAWVVIWSVGRHLLGH